MSQLNKQLAAEEQIAQIRQEFRNALPGKLANLERRINLMYNGGLPGVDQELIRAVHSLVGAAGAFGYIELSSKFRELENLLIEFSSQVALDKRQIDRIWSHFVGVRSWFDRVPAQSGNVTSNPTASDQINHKALAIEPCSILFVSDDEHFSKWMNFALQQENHTLSIVENMEQMRNALTEVHYDFVFLEVMLRKSNGFEMAKTIRKEFPDPYIPILFITSFSDEATRIKAIESGGDNVLIKPVSIDLVRMAMFALKRLIDKTKANT